MKCPVCGAEQPVGMAYCDQCGSPIGDDTAVSAAAPITPVVADMGNAANVQSAAPPQPDPVAVAATASAPIDTGTPDVSAPTDPPFAADAPGEAKTLIFKFPNGGQFIPTTDVTNIGRSDAAQDWHPELDVIPYGGGVPEMGVSRHHARVLRQNGKYMLMDVGSTNGTYVNGTALEYNKAMDLKDGDTVAFGAFSTQIVLQ